MSISGRLNIFCVIFIIYITVNVSVVSGKTVPRSVSPDDNEEQTDNLIGSIRYDEYPLVVPKRAAILLDRIMVALHHALEDGNQKGVQKISELYKDRGHGDGRVNKIGNDFTLKFIPSSNENVNNISEYLPAEMDSDINDLEGRLPDDMMGLQRRGNGEGGLSVSKGRVYWRCYFNAVTCF